MCKYLFNLVEQNNCKRFLDDYKKTLQKLNLKK